MTWNLIVFGGLGAWLGGQIGFMIGLLLWAIFHILVAMYEISMWYKIVTTKEEEE